MKITLAYAAGRLLRLVALNKVSKPQWIIVPLLFIAAPIWCWANPTLGDILLVSGGGAIMFLAGVHWAYFATVIAGAVGGERQCFNVRHRLADAERLSTATLIRSLTQDPLGAGYHITQAKVALGSGGVDRTRVRGAPKTA
jgi:rod shape determining protein RodA